MAWFPPAHQRRSWLVEQAGDYATNRFHHLRDTTRHGAAALSRAHETKGSVWAMIHIFEGKLRCCIEASFSESILEPGQPSVSEPEVQHHEWPTEPVRFYLELFGG